MEDYIERRKNCVAFDDLTRRLYDLPSMVDVGLLEQYLIGNSRSRRGSSLLGERAFFDIVRTNVVPNVLEVGGNDGRHTRRFLDETEAEIHTFEPNVFAIEFYSKIVSEPRLKLNMFGLSDEMGTHRFNILRRLGEKDFDAVNGCSSFGRIDSEDAHYSSIVSNTIRGDSYLDVADIKGDFALWIDVEGFSRQAVSGFGDRLGDATVVICEVEMADYLSTGSNADVVIAQLEEAGLSILYRDFQNFGQANLFAINPEKIEAPEMLSDKHFAKFKTDVRAIAVREGF